MKRTLIAILLALALVVIPVGTAFAATTQNVIVTATPAFVSLTCDPLAWTVNGEGALTFPEGDGVIRPNTTYYANPDGDMTAPSSPNVLASECLFEFTNAGTVSIDIVCDMSDFTGGDADMTNGELGYTNNGATVFGASGYKEGDDAMAGSVIFKLNATGSDEFVQNLLPSGTQKWGAALKTRTNAFAGPNASTSTILCTAAEYTP